MRLSKTPFVAFRQRAAACGSALVDCFRQTTPTFASRKVFSATYTPRQKMISFFSPQRRRTLRGFFDKLKDRS